MVAARLADVLHQGQRGLRRLALATVVVVRGDPVVAAVGKACEPALHRAQRHRELRDDLVGVSLLLPALKKACGEGGSQERAA
jgi:hypothetical protein